MRYLLDIFLFSFAPNIYLAIFIGSSLPILFGFNAITFYISRSRSFRHIRFLLLLFQYILYKTADNESIRKLRNNVFIASNCFFFFFLFSTPLHPSSYVYHSFTLFIIRYTFVWYINRIEEYILPLIVTCARLFGGNVY